MQTTRKETILQKVEIEQPTYEDHFYARYVREKLLEEDELSYEEEAFMKGYEESEEKVDEVDMEEEIEEP